MSLATGGTMPLSNMVSHSFSFSNGFMCEPAWSFTARRNLPHNQLYQLWPYPSLQPLDNGRSARLSRYNAAELLAQASTVLLIAIYVRLDLPLDLSLIHI